MPYHKKYDYPLGLVCKVCSKPITRGSKGIYCRKHMYYDGTPKLSKEHKEKIGKANTGKNNGNWKGGISDAFYARRIEKNICEICGVPSSEKKLDVHHKDGNHFNNKPENWQILCRKCHMTEDGRMKNLEIAHVKLSPEEKRESLKKKIEYIKKWALENSEKRKATTKAWYLKNKEKRSEKMKNRRLENPEKYREISRISYHKYKNEIAKRRKIKRMELKGANS